MMLTDSSGHAQDEVVRSNVERQLAEVNLIRCMFAAPDEFCLRPDEAEALAAAEAVAAAEAEGEKQPHSHLKLTNSPTISFALNLLDVRIGGRHLSLHFSLPKLYPSHQQLAVTVEGGGSIQRRQHVTLQAAGSGAAAAAAGGGAEGGEGEEAVLRVIDAVKEAAEKLLAEGAGSPAAENAADSCQQQKSPARRLSRSLIWFHHIKSEAKRRSILEWSRELQLGGYCKPGFPGVLLVEGDADDVAEYIQRLHRLRWQAMNVRAEQSEEEDELGAKSVKQLRKFASCGVKELPEEGGMSQLGAFCRELGLEELFLTALKIKR